MALCTTSENMAVCLIAAWQKGLLGQYQSTSISATILTPGGSSPVELLNPQTEAFKDTETNYFVEVLHLDFKIVNFKFLLH